MPRDGHAVLCRIRRSAPALFVAFLIVAGSTANASSSARAHNDLGEHSRARPDTKQQVVAAGHQPRALTAADVQEVHEVATNDPVIFITVDDGNTVTPELAEYLDSQRIPITTFFVAARLREHRRFWLARRNVTFENHSLTHRFMGSLSLKEQTREVCGASAEIKKITGESPRYFRPPGGSRNKTLKTALARCGIKYLVMWKASAARGVLHTWGGRPLAKGDIVLLHALTSLPRTLKVVLAAAKKQGLRPALLRDYLK